MFYQIFLSPQVKRYAIITYKHGIHELPHELSNDLKLIKKLENLLNLSDWTDNHDPPYNSPSTE